MEYSELTSKLGVMQGRLLEQTSAGYQAFPGKNWMNEFKLAADRQIGHIEWVLDSKNIWENPVLSVADQIRKVSVNSGVQVRSLCADFVMQSWEEEDPYILNIFRRLIERLDEIGATHIVLPFVDSASMKAGRVTHSDANALISEILDMDYSNSINISVESDLMPEDLAHFIDNFGNSRIGVNYDIGNSAALGYSWQEEFELYWNHVNLLHVKDRKINDTSVKLGTGDASVVDVLIYAFQHGFDGPITLQMFRDKKGIDVFDSQLSWLADSLLGESNA